MSANVLAETFEGVNVLKEYNFWLFMFFTSGAAFSFKDVTSTKMLQVVIAGVRAACLLMFIIGPLSILFKK